MKKVLSAMFVSGLLMAAVQVDAQNKTGYISVQQLIGSMPETAKADTTHQEYSRALYQSAQERENVLNAAIQKFNDDSAKFTSAQKEVKRSELQKMYQDLAGEEQRIQDQMENRRQQLLAPIQKKAFDAIQAVAKENGYSYVIESQAVLVGPPGDNIFPLVAKKLGLKTTTPSPNAANSPVSRPADDKADDKPAAPAPKTTPKGKN